MEFIKDVYTLDADLSNLDDKVMLDLVDLSYRSNPKMFKTPITGAKKRTLVGKIVGIISSGEKIDPCTFLFRTIKGNYFAVVLRLKCSLSYIPENKCFGLTDTKGRVEYFNHCDDIVLTTLGTANFFIGNMGLNNKALRITGISKNISCNSNEQSVRSDA